MATERSRAVATPCSIEQRRGRLGDLALIRERARSLTIEASLRELERASRGLLVAVLVLDALCAVGAIGVVLLGPAWSVPIAILVLGSRQRALGNALHELAHVPGR